MVPVLFSQVSCQMPGGRWQVAGGRWQVAGVLKGVSPYPKPNLTLDKSKGQEPHGKNRIFRQKPDTESK